MYVHTSLIDAPSMPKTYILLPGLLDDERDQEQLVVGIDTPFLCYTSRSLHSLTHTYIHFQIPFTDGLFLYRNESLRTGVL